MSPPVVVELPPPEPVDETRAVHTGGVVASCIEAASRTDRQSAVLRSLIVTSANGASEERRG